MSADIHLLDVVALTVDMPRKKLCRGQVGTVVELLGAGDYEVEFSGDDGRTYAQVAISGKRLMVLHYQPSQAA